MYPYLDEFDHAEGSSIVYGIDWIPDLTVSETISTSVWQVSDGITSSNNSVDGKSTLIKVTGGTAGNLYSATNTITTSAGNIFVKSLKFSCKHF